MVCVPVLERIEIRITNWNDNIEKLDWTRGGREIHIVIEELAPLPKIIGCACGAKHVMILSDNKIADLPCALLTDPSRQTNAIGISRRHQSKKRHSGCATKRIDGIISRAIDRTKFERINRRRTGTRGRMRRTR